jgi:PadR family transcriptional regulator, regulatory protein AphA
MARIKSGLSAGEYAVLGVLRERPMHGYEVARRFAADLDLGLVLPMDMSSVYALLKELQEHGLIEGEREVVGLRPPRTVFHLTADAESAFDHWLEEPVERLRAVRSDLLLKLYFARAISTPLTARLLDAQIEVVRAYGERLTALAAESEPGSFERLVRRSKITAATATLAWLDEERAALAG